MYSYHNTIKKRITQGEMTGFEFIENHPRIKGKVLMLYFNTAPYERPIRQHRFGEYKTILETFKQ